MSKLRLPAINAPTVEGKLEQIRSYLFQLTEYINQLPAVEEDGENAVKNLNQTSFIQTTHSTSQASPQPDSNG